MFGNVKEDIFHIELDYRLQGYHGTSSREVIIVLPVFMQTIIIIAISLKVQADKYGCLVHAYVLMTNHIHLLLTQAKKDSASLLMKHLGQRYVQYINRRYKRSGTF